MRMVILLLLLGCASPRKDFMKCTSEMIQIARQNWDTVAPNGVDEAEFVAQDQLTEFITTQCYDEF